MLLFIWSLWGYPNFMELGKTENADPADMRAMSASTLRDMLATLQEAVVTADAEQRRALLKDVIGKLREVLAAGQGA
ncbi:MAG: hypothetical protein JWR80_7547 [Bradyrhizobium sp.]|nr:hypothetical protein [Bradyrhizobium sp.]